MSESERMFLIAVASIVTVLIAFIYLFTEPTYICKDETLFKKMGTVYVETNHICLEGER